MTDKDIELAVEISDLAIVEPPDVEFRWDDGIEGVHREIAVSNSSRIGVLAGPGTGKTAYGIMRRVARLLQDGVNPEKILLVSFTRTAAHDLADKLSALRVQGAEKVRATTIHSYCFELLNREVFFELTGRVSRPLLEHEVKLMLRDLQIGDANLREREARLLAFEAGWARAESDHPVLAAVHEDQRFEREVLGWLRHHRGMLIGEVVPIAFSVLRSDPGNPQLENYQHIIVDEYQDLNYLEQRFIELLSNFPDSNVCVVGDDDQSIYGFKHANPDGIRNFVADRRTTPFEIETCGRCPQNVVAIANSLIGQDPNRSKQALVALEDRDGVIALPQWEYLSEEVDGIATAIASDISSGRFVPGDILVLVHRESIASLLKRRLDELTIPSHMFYHQESLKTPSAQEALALLQEVAAPDPISLRVLLGIGERTGRAEGYQKLRGLARESGRSERELLEQARRGVKLGIVIPAINNRFRHSMARVEALTTMELPDLVDDLFPDGVAELRSLRQIALEGLAESETTEDLLDFMVTRVSQYDVPSNPDFVRIMSLHKSKGLTSPAVYIMGSVYGVIPTVFGASNDDELAKTTDEQRRLFYVAITRASEQLVVSCCRKVPLAFARLEGIPTADGSTRTIDGIHFASTLSCPYLSELGQSAPRSVRGPAWLEHYAARD